MFLFIICGDLFLIYFFFLHVKEEINQTLNHGNELNNNINRSNLLVRPPPPRHNKAWWTFFTCTYTSTNHVCVYTKHYESLDWVSISEHQKWGSINICYVKAVGIVPHRKFGRCVDGINRMWYPFSNECTFRSKLNHF